MEEMKKIGKKNRRIRNRDYNKKYTYKQIERTDRILR